MRMFCILRLLDGQVDLYGNKNIRTESLVDKVADLTEHRQPHL